METIERSDTDATQRRLAELEILAMETEEDDDDDEDLDDDEEEEDDDAE